MALNIGKEITALRRMTVANLRRKYAEVFGEGTTSRHKQFLFWGRSRGSAIALF